MNQEDEDCGGESCSIFSKDRPPGHPVPTKDKDKDKAEKKEEDDEETEEVTSSSTAEETAAFVLREYVDTEGDVSEGAVSGGETPTTQRRNGSNVFTKKKNNRKPTKRKRKQKQGPSLKGRIVVYSVSGCPHCRSAKSTLLKQGLPFVEVNLDDHPDFREDMIERTKKHIVPQIFFNDVYVGGNDALQELIKNKEELARLVQLVTDSKPSDKAPAVPKKKAAKGSVSSSTPEVECQPDVYWDIIEKMRRPVAEGGLSIKNRMYHLRKYKKCFIGKELVDWLMQLEDENLSFSSRKDAVDFGNVLMEKHFFHHVTFAHILKDDEYFYRFIQDEDTSRNVLNTGQVSSCEPPSASELAKDLRKATVALYDKYLAQDGHKVNYKGIAQDEDWAKYKSKSYELQRVDISDLSDEQKLAFFINVYNVLVIHAHVELGPPSNTWQRYSFFNRVGYRIGGRIFCLNDIENGILRANSKPPYGRKKQFRKSDPRLAFALKYKEPRIHFALVCGARSCPPVKTYRAKDINASLDAATFAFFAEDDQLSINEGKREVKLSRILQWYRVDFGRNDKEMLQWVARYAPSDKADLLKSWAEEGKFVVSFKTYDWTPNAL
ncbi:DEP domain-containing protein [Balamuthia mandrillaris]